MNLTYWGHSFFELETTDRTTVLVDPFIDGNPWNDVSPDEFDPDLVAVTHGHFDHVEESPAFGTTIVTQVELAGYLEEVHDHEDTVGMNIGGSYADSGVEFTMTKAFHSSGTQGEADFDSYGGTPAGFLIDDGETRLYHAGDTGLFGDMKTVIRDVYDPDIAALPIGDFFTMGIEQAAIATEWLGVDHVIPVHYDTVPPIEQEPAAFVEAVGETASVHVLDAGESLSL